VYTATRKHLRMVVMSTHSLREVHKSSLPAEVWVPAEDLRVCREQVQEGTTGVTCRELAAGVTGWLSKMVRQLGVVIRRLQIFPH
jgi:hypothetical protein